jgi:hypothetical protein
MQMGRQDLNRAAISTQTLKANAIAASAKVIALHWRCKRGASIVSICRRLTLICKRSFTLGAAYRMPFVEQLLH